MALKNMALIRQAAMNCSPISPQSWKILSKKALRRPPSLRGFLYIFVDLLFFLVYIYSEVLQKIVTFGESG